MAEEIEQIEAKVGDKSISLRSVSINTLITIGCLGLLIYLATVFTAHVQATTLATTVLEKIERAIRIGNCLNAYPENQREAKLEWCRRYAE